MTSRLPTYALAMLALVAPRATAAQRDTALVVLSVKQIDIALPSDSVATAQVPVWVVRKGTVDSISVVDVSLGGAARAELRPAFRAKLVAAGADAPRVGVLELTLEPRRLKAAGSYVVRLLATMRDGSETVAQVVELTVVRPAAVLQAGPVTLERVRRFMGSDTETRLPLWVAEQSGRAAIQELGVGSTTLSGPGIPSFPSVRLDWDTTLRAGEARAESIVIDGELPLGSTKGTLTLRSDQVSAPVTITVQVRVRRSWSWLFGAMILGIVVGHIVRILLERRRLELQARTIANLQLAEIQALVQRVADSRTRTRLEGIAGALKTAMDGTQPAVRRSKNAFWRALRAAFDGTYSTASAMTAAAEQAAKDAKSAVDELAIRQQRAKAKLEAVRTALRRPEGHFADVAEQVRASREWLDDVARTIDEGDLTAMEPELEDVSESVFHQLRPLAAAWAQAVDEALGSIGTWRSDPIDRARETLTDKVGVLSAAVDDPTHAVNPLVDAAAALAWQVERQLIGQILRQVLLTASDVTRALTLATAAQPTLGATMQARIAEIGGRVDALGARSQLPGTPGALRAIGTQVRALREDMVAVIRMVDHQSAPAADVETALAEGRFIDAVRTVLSRAAAQAHDGVGGRELGDDDTVAPIDVTATEIATQEGEEPPARGRGAWGNAQARGARAYGLAAIPALERQQGVVAFAQWIATAILVLVAGFLIFRDLFVGDTASLLTLFFWGFFVDVSLAHVQSLAKPLTGQTVPTRQAQVT